MITYAVYTVPETNQPDQCGVLCVTRISSRSVDPLYVQYIMETAT